MVRGEREVSKGQRSIKEDGGRKAIISTRWDRISKVTITEERDLSRKEVVAFTYVDVCT